MSAHNPFRANALSPSPTGRTTASTAPPPSFRTTDERHPTVVTGDLDEDLPPAYTATPAAEQGEATIEYGPRRPFQQAPRPVQPPPQPVSVQSTGYSSHLTTPYSNPPQSTYSLGSGRPTLLDRLVDQLTGLTTNNSPWSTYPAHASPYQSPTAPPPQQRPIATNYTGSISPPPIHPSQPPRSPPRQPSPSSPPLSDFARDFYAAGSEPSSRSALDSHSTGNSSFAPPSGPPPSQRRSHSPPAVRPPPRSEGGTPSGRSDDDGKPTRTPVPGRPLLLNGNTLLYPAGHWCHKCSNTGYKHFDPLRPCKKCWSRYAKAYTGALAYAPTGSSSLASSSFQKPLPTSFLSAPRSLQRSRSGSHLGTPQINSMQPSHYRSVSSCSQGRTLPGGYPGNSQTRPPTYLPGDSRIGGTLCWRCAGSGITHGGRGLVSMLLAEPERCYVCNGIGRLFS